LSYSRENGNPEPAKTIWIPAGVYPEENRGRKDKPKNLAMGISFKKLNCSILTLFHYSNIPAFQFRTYLVFVGRLKSNLKKSVEVFNGEEAFCGGPVPSLKHSRRPPLPKLT